MVEPEALWLGSDNSSRWPGVPRPGSGHALLDEATCYLDPVTEERVEQAFAARPGTLVVIAHRITSAERADRVLVLDGTDAVVDRPEALATRSALYRDLAGHWSAPPGSDLSSIPAVQ